MENELFMCEKMLAVSGVEYDKKQVSISKETGLIDRYNVDGVDYLKTQSGQIQVYDDNEDPWGMTVDGFTNRIGEFKLLSKEDANAFNGYPMEDRYRLCKGNKFFIKLALAS